MDFRLVPESATWNDLDSIAFKAYGSSSYMKVIGSRCQGVTRLASKKNVKCYPATPTLK